MTRLPFALVVGLSCACVGGAPNSHAPGANVPQPETLAQVPESTNSNRTCSGNQDLLIKNDTVTPANAATAAVDASGNCTAVILSSTIGGPISLKARDDATIRVEGSTVEGSLRAKDNGSILLKSSVVRGRKLIEDNGSIEDLGGNTSAE